jgi:chloramphenicol-sensitive protein RarD
MPDTRRGFVFGLVAYTTWGLFPLYWPLLDPTPAIQILAHRMLWSLVFIGALLAARRRWAFVAELRHDLKRTGLLVLAGLLISVNWGVYIWAVNAGHVVESSLGYFITPLVNIGLGVLIFKEHLQRTQWIAVVVGVAAVLVIAVGYGQVPWIGLTLAASFGGYGLVKKVARTPALESLAVETSVMALPAIAYLIFANAQGCGAFGHVSAGLDVLLISSGIVTGVPLLFFAAAARRVPLSVMGMLQYITPVLQFLIGIFLRHEALSGSELAGFALVWVALAILGIGELRRLGRAPRAAVLAAQ